MAKRKDDDVAGTGHNSGLPSADQIKAFSQRVLKVDEEISALNEDKKEIYSEAKGNGFDIPALKKVIGELRKKAKDPDKYETAAAMEEIYRNAVGL